jgi:hypothetical protein
MALLHWQSRSDLHQVLNQQDLTDRGTVPDDGAAVPLDQ